MALGHHWDTVKKPCLLPCALLSAKHKPSAPEERRQNPPASRTQAESHCSLEESVNQLICSVVSNSLQPHGLQHARLPCPSPTPGAYSNSCPLSQWCHPNISSSVVPFSSCPQSFPASWSFQMSQFFASGGQSIGVSASASILPINIQNWFPLVLTVLRKEFPNSKHHWSARKECVSAFKGGSLRVTIATRNPKPSSTPDYM